MKDKIKVVAIIPAKGQSERLPNKNILEINGRPMLVWAIRACQESKYDIEPWVSSESDTVLEIAEKYGAKIHKRDPVLSGASVLKQEVIRSAASYIVNNCGENEKPDVFISLQPNSPQIQGYHLDQGLDVLLNSSKGDRMYEVFSVDKNYHQNAAYRMFRGDYVFQKDLSIHCAVAVCDIIDINTKEDFVRAEASMVNHWEKALYTQKGETIEGNYLNNDIKIKNSQTLINYISRNISLNSNSKVLEIGCNLARNLRMLHKAFNCDVTGYEINEECVNKNRLHFRDKGTFYQKDLRNSGCFKLHPDNYFDAGISMGFLMHIPRGHIKENLLREFIRVCKNVYIFEIYDFGGKDIIDIKNQWSVSYEDYRIYDKRIVCTNVIDNNNGKFRLYVLKK